MSNFPILIAEDNLVSRKFLEKILVKAGHELVFTENGLKALEYFDEKFFPIVLTDWIMPEMDGLELCRAIRKRNTKGYVFIILLTSNDSKDEIVTGLEAGADDYLTKPVHPSELVVRLNTARRILDLERSMKKANEEIRTLSNKDFLTGCFNRSFLNERLPQEIERSERYKRPLSLIMCDIDYFKKVNDTYGHLTGDFVLKKFTEKISESIRSGVDWIARYGGEEFLIVLPETDLKSCCALAERLRMVISKTVINRGKQDICITASFGVSCFNPVDLVICDNSVSSDILISQADQCLYRAKNEGRNRVRY